MSSGPATSGSSSAHTETQVVDEVTFPRKNPLNLTKNRLFQIPEALNTILLMVVKNFFSSVSEKSDFSKNS